MNNIYLFIKYLLNLYYKINEINLKIQKWTAIEIILLI